MPPFIHSRFLFFVSGYHLFRAAIYSQPFFVSGRHSFPAVEAVFCFLFHAIDLFPAMEAIDSFPAVERASR
jgi:hypothetical protein